MATTQGNHCQWPQRRGTIVSGHNAGEPLSVATTQGHHCQWPQRRDTTVSGHNAGEPLSVATTQGNHCQWPQRRGTIVSGHNAGEPCTQRHSTGLTSDVVKPWLPLLLVLVLIHIAHQLGPVVQAGRKVAIPFRFWIPVVEIAWGARHQFVVLPPVASRRLSGKLRVSQTELATGSSQDRIIPSQTESVNCSQAVGLEYFHNNAVRQKRVHVRVSHVHA